MHRRNSRPCGVDFSKSQIKNASGRSCEETRARLDSLEVKKRAGDGGSQARQARQGAQPLSSTGRARYLTLRPWTRVRRDPV